MTAAENRTAQIVAAERARLDKLVQEARREDPEPMMVIKLGYFFGVIFAIFGQFLENFCQFLKFFWDDSSR